MLVVEVDGDVHDSQTERDEVRSTDLEMRGFQVVWFRNEQVTGNSDAVIAEIVRLVQERIAQPKKL
jgi:leucyl-tRNA synthetase